MSFGVLDQLLGRKVVCVERGPVARFAAAVHDQNQIYQRPDVAKESGVLPHIPTPPTFGFSALDYWGCFAELQPGDREGELVEEFAHRLESLLKRGGVILHAEQEFNYHRPMVVGDVLTSEGDIIHQYVKCRHDRVLTFLVIEKNYRDETGNLVLTSRTTLVHRP